jgi:hypothetical protein
MPGREPARADASCGPESPATRGQEERPLTLVAICLGAIGLTVCFALKTAPGRSRYPQAAPFVGGGTVETHAWLRYHFRACSMALVVVPHCVV